MIIVYLVWINAIDKAAVHGGRPKRWIKRLPIWRCACRRVLGSISHSFAYSFPPRHFSNYYPVSLVQEAALPPDRRYMSVLANPEHDRSCQSDTRSPNRLVSATTRMVSSAWEVSRFSLPTADQRY